MYVLVRVIESLPQKYFQNDMYIHTCVYIYIYTRMYVLVSVIESLPQKYFQNDMYIHTCIYIYICVYMF